jgi:outer membrane lipoprotein
LCFFIVQGCAHPISRGLRQSVDKDVSLSKIFATPENLAGTRVMLGGKIVETRNLQNRTEIEVIQQFLDLDGYPSRGDKTLGRFVFSQPGYLEPEIYSKGRSITGAGEVRESKAGKVGNRDYVFPVIVAEELHLWDEYYDRPHYYDPNYSYFYGSFFYPYNYGPYSPYYYPFPRHHPRRHRHHRH